MVVIFDFKVESAFIRLSHLHQRPKQASDGVFVDRFLQIPRNFRNLVLKDNNI